MLFLRGLNSTQMLETSYLRVNTRSSIGNTTREHSKVKVRRNTRTIEGAMMDIEVNVSEHGLINNSFMLGL